MRGSLAFFAIASLFFSACAPVPVSVPPAPSHVALDNSLAVASQGVRAAAASVSQAQVQAAKIFSSVHDPLIEGQITDLQNSLTASATQLSGVTAVLTTTTASLTWYEGAAAQAWTGWATATADLNKSNAALQAANARASAEIKKAWFWRLIVLGEIACVGIWLGLKYGTQILGDAAGIAAKIP